MARRPRPRARLAAETHLLQRARGKIAE
jgi:hypothetical protein